MHPCRLIEISPRDVSLFILERSCWAIFAQSREMYDDRSCLLDGSIASMVIEIRVRKARIGSIYLYSGLYQFFCKFNGNSVHCRFRGLVRQIIDLKELIVSIAGLRNRTQPG